MEYDLNRMSGRMYEMFQELGGLEGELQARADELRERIKEQELEFKRLEEERNVIYRHFRGSTLAEISRELNLEQDRVREIVVDFCGPSAVI